MAEKKIDDGGPAFPGTEPSRLHDSLGGQRSREWPINLGMSLRDWFAGQALTAYLSSEVASAQLFEAVSKESVEGDSRRELIHSILARRAYLLADAMLAARKVTP